MTNTSTDDLIEEIDVYINNITWQDLLNNNQLSKHLDTYDLSQLVSRVLSNIILLQFPLERFEHDISKNLTVEVFSEEPSELTFFKSIDSTQQLNIRVRDDSITLPYKNDTSLPYQGWMESKNVTCNHISDCIGVYINGNKKSKKILVLTPISSVLQLRPSFNLPNNPNSWKTKRVCQPESPEANEILNLLKSYNSDILYFKYCSNNYLDAITKNPGKSFPYNPLSLSKFSIINQLFLLFNEFEIVSNELISQYLTLDPYNSFNTNTIDKLLEIAELIDGNWVLKSKFCFTQLEDHQAHYIRLCRDLLLSLLYRQSQQEISKSAAGGLTIEPFQKATGLPIEFVQYLIKRVAIQISSCWYLPYPRDDKFIKLNPKLATNSQKYWTNRLSESAIEIQKLNQNGFTLDDACCAIISYLEYSSPKTLEEIVNMLRNRGSYMLNIQHDKGTWMESVKNVAINLGNDNWFLRSNKLNNFIASRESLLKFISLKGNKISFTKNELESITGILPDIVFRRIVSEFMTYSDSAYHLKFNTKPIKMEI